MAFLLADDDRVFYTTGVPDSPSDVSLRLGHISDPGHLVELTGHGPGQIWLALARDGRFALSAGADGTLRLWDNDAQESRRVRREAVGLGPVAISPDGRSAAYVCGETIRVCDLKTGDETMSVEGHKTKDGSRPPFNPGKSPSAPTDAGSFLVPATSACGTYKPGTRSGESHRGVCGT